MHIAMWVPASLSRRFKDTYVYGTGGSVKIWTNRHKISVDTRIFLECTVETDAARTSTAVAASGRKEAARGSYGSLSVCLAGVEGRWPAGWQRIPDSLCGRLALACDASLRADSAAATIISASSIAPPLNSMLQAPSMHSAPYDDKLEFHGTSFNRIAFSQHPRDDVTRMLRGKRSRGI